MARALESFLEAHLCKMFDWISRCPDYYHMIEDPIDLTTIEKNINSGHYRATKDFHEDFLRLFGNAEVRNEWMQLLWNLVSKPSLDSREP